MKRLNFKTEKREVRKKHHVLTIDCSGSMYYSLPEIREWIKNNIGAMIGPKDLISIIWFSSSGEAGFVVENVSVETAVDLEMIKKNVDRYLRPICLTGFKDPLVLFDKKSFTGYDVNFIFMTDGMENQSPRNSILALCDKISDKIVSGSIVEYGNYCDREFMAEMASRLNIDHVFSETAHSVTERIQEKTSNVGDYISIDLDLDAQLFAVTENDILTINPRSGQAKVPVDSRIVFQDVGEDNDETGRLTKIFSKMFNVQNNYDELKDLIYETQDMRLIKLFENCINKVDFNNLRTTVKEMVYDESLRYVEGVGIPLDTTGLCVLEVLKYAADQNIEFDYSKIKLKPIGPKRKSEQALPINVLKHVYNINGLVFAEDMPNVSMRIQRDIEITLPDNDFGFKSIKHFDWRNVNIISDGFLNVEIIPLFLSKEQHSFLSEVIDEEFRGSTEPYMVNLTKIPILSNHFLKDLIGSGAKNDIVHQIIKRSVDLLVVQAQAKVLGDFTKEDRKADKLQGLVDKYGEKVALWLDSLGIKDGGYAPPGIKTEYTGDVRTSQNLEVKIQSFSSLPSLNAVRKKTEEIKNDKKGTKKYTPSESLINESMELYEGLSKDELKERFENNKKLKNAISAELSSLKMALLLSPKYRKERFSLLEENQTESIGNFNATMTLVEKEVKL